MRIGLFGGSFNPVHKGHLAIVTQVLARGSVDRVLVIPAAQNPLKEGLPQLPDELRLQMLKAAFQGLPQVEVRPDEIQRGGPSYTWQTIEALQGEFPAAELFLLLGQDAYEMFPHWHRGERILELCRILVFPRSGAGTFSPDLRGGRVEVVELNLPELSSTQIRSWNHKPALAREFLPPQVFEIWRSHWEHFHEI